MSESLPENWSETSIGEVVSLAGNRADPAQAEGVPFLGLEHIEAHSTRILEPGDAADMKSSSPRFKAGDVLYSRLRPYLNKVCVPDFDGLCSGEIYVLRPEVGIVSDFLKYRINSFDFVDFAKHLDNGDRPRVKYDEVSQFRFGLPPSKEQQRILSVLEPTLAKIDEAEEALERVRRNLDRYRASVLKAACEGRLVPSEAELARQEGRDYEPASELLKRILIARREAWEKAQLEAYAKKDKTPPKDWKSRYPEPQAPDTSDLPELPEGWCWATIDQLVIESIRTGLSIKSDSESGGVRSLRLDSLHGKYLDLTKWKVLPLKETDVENLRVLNGDFFVSRGNGSLQLLASGATAIGVEDFLIFPDIMFRLRFGEEWLALFVSTIWNSRQIRDQVKSAAKSTSGVYKITKGSLEKIVVPLPPEMESKRIVGKVSEVESLIEKSAAVAKRRLFSCHTLRQSLLKHAFAGKLVPQDPADEPASVLLERIRAQRLELKGGTTPRKRAVHKTKKTS